VVQQANLQLNSSNVIKAISLQRFFCSGLRNKALSFYWPVPILRESLTCTSSSSLSNI